jgi:hypothetical protein
VAQTMGNTGAEITMSAMHASIGAGNESINHMLMVLLLIQVHSLYFVPTKSKQKKAARQYLHSGRCHTCPHMCRLHGRANGNQMTLEVAGTGGGLSS